jgi:hypothetical protein
MNINYFTCLINEELNIAFPIDLFRVNDAHAYCNFIITCCELLNHYYLQLFRFNYIVHLHELVP